jgi:hypothetical protein
MSTASRDKMISFRLSTREYEQLREFRLSQGARSVSALARAAVSKLLRDPAPVAADPLEARINELEGQLQTLFLEMKKLRS